MCGIAGILNFDGKLVNTEEIESMTSCISHRGPDGNGFFIKDQLAFGHQRLSIIDLEGGKQPMCDHSQRVYITFNGEIYNYAELRNELISDGIIFKTHSDTEVIIYAYIKWGIECVKKFRGMFAFALVDYKVNKLYLARDQFGIKPLIYRLENDFLAFSSEINPLKKVRDRIAEGSLKSVDFFLRYQYIPAPHTIYKNVYKLLPASYMEVDLNTGKHTISQYWDLNFNQDKLKNEKQWLADIEEAIDDSVKAHMVSDVPFGVFLSGGIDSSLIAYKMARFSNQPLKAFTITFNEQDFSEIEFAKKASKISGVELISENVTDSALDVLPYLVEKYGEPFGDSSAVPTWFVSRLARQHVPLVLSGDGGDEIFGGYDSYMRWMKNHPFENSVASFKKSPYWATRIALNGIKLYAKHGTLNVLDVWKNHIMYVNDELRDKAWKNGNKVYTKQKDGLFDSASSHAINYSRLSYAQYIDVKTYLPCDILNKVDIASMSHGLEVRPPFIDTKLVSLAAQLPDSMKYHLLTNGSYTGKYILKQLTEKYFNHDFVYRKKQGFGLPIYHWFKKDQQARIMLERLLNENAIMKELFDTEFIKQLLNNHGEKYDYAGILWLFLVLGIWLEKNADVNFN